MEPLKLIAKDAEDIQTVAALLQDSVASACDINYKPDEKSFVMVLQRFLWDKIDQPYQRANCAIDISGVENVQITGVNPRDPTALFDLLTVKLEDEFLCFIFAGEGKMRLKLADWALRIEDFGDPWDVKFKPEHQIQCFVSVSHHNVWPTIVYFIE